MSADNWALCPRCIERGRLDHDRKVADVMDSYGKVPFPEFDAARAAIEPFDPENFRTFREDYEFYMQGHEVVADYSGSCSVCGLSLDFTDRHRLDVW